MPNAMLGWRGKIGVYSVNFKENEGRSGRLTKYSLRLRPSEA